MLGLFSRNDGKVVVVRAVVLTIRNLSQRHIEEDLARVARARMNSSMRTCECVHAAWCGVLVLIHRKGGVCVCVEGRGK